jgi:hypothetical protein
MFGDKFVKTFRQKKGLNQQQISTTEFLNDNNSEVQNFFDTYIVPLATSTVTGINSECMQTLATNIHNRNASNISFNERKHLLKVSNSNIFNDSDARFMESKIRYALIEHLRPKLLETLDVSSYVKNELKIPRYIGNEVRKIIAVDNFHLQQMNTQLSMGLQRGVKERRTYGGCSSSRTESREFGPELGTQNIFGGKSEADSEDSSGESDKFGPLIFKCTKGHQNKREKNGWVYECQKCGEDVSCGKKKP